jgi:Tfp pilus assembly protein PilV
MQKEFDKLNTEKAFTLIEALVGIAIILIAVIGPLSVTTNGIKTITQNKNRIIASYLAEEMVEELRNYRDHFAVACQNYTYDIFQDGISNQKCANIDVSSFANINDTAQAVA